MEKSPLGVAEAVLSAAKNITGGTICRIGCIFSILKKAKTRFRCELRKTHFKLSPKPSLVAVMNISHTYVRCTQ